MCVWFNDIRFVIWDISFVIYSIKFFLVKLFVSSSAMVRNDWKILVPVCLGYSSPIALRPEALRPETYLQGKVLQKFFKIWNKSQSYKEK